MNKLTVTIFWNDNIVIRVGEKDVIYGFLNGYRLHRDGVEWQIKGADEDVVDVTDSFEAARTRFHSDAR